MGSLSNYVTQKVLDAFFNKVSFTSPSSLWFALYNTDPTAGNTGVEIYGEGYARVQITAMTFAQIVSGKMTTSNSSKIVLARATANWTQANYWAVLDAQTGGNLLVKETLLTSVTVLTGQQPEFDVGNLIVTLE